MGHSRSESLAYTCRCQAAIAKAKGKMALAQRLESEADQWDPSRPTTIVPGVTDIPCIVPCVCPREESAA